MSPLGFRAAPPAVHAFTALTCVGWVGQIPGAALPRTQHCASAVGAQGERACARTGCVLWALGGSGPGQGG